MKRWTFVVVVALVLFGAPGDALGTLVDDLKEAEAEIDALVERMEVKELEANYWTGQVSQTRNRLRKLGEDLVRAEAVLADLQLSIADTQGAIDFTIAEISAKEAELAETRLFIADTHDMVVSQAVELFKRGGGQIEVQFDFESVQQAAVAVKYGSTVIEETKQALERLETLRGQEENQIVRIEDQKTTLDGQLGKLETAQSDGEIQRAIVEETTNQAAIELTNERAFLQAVQAAIDEFENEIEILEQEEEKIKELLAQAQRPGGLAPADLYPPVPGPVSSGFGNRVHPILGTTKLHTGLDMNASFGEPIAAAAGGRVIYASARGGYGNTVMIDHGGGMATLYAHQSSIAVSVGQDVSITDVIGYIGSTGLSTGPHLHFEVRLNGNPIDPLPFFA